MLLRLVEAKPRQTTRPNHGQNPKSHHKRIVAPPIMFFFLFLGPGAYWNASMMKGTSNTFKRFCDSLKSEPTNSNYRWTQWLLFFFNPHVLGWNCYQLGCQKTFAVFNIWSGWSLEFASKAISWGTLCHAEIPKLWHSNMHHIVYAHRSTIYRSYTILPPHWTHFLAIHFGAR